MTGKPMRLSASALLLAAMTALAAPAAAQTPVLGDTRLILEGPAAAKIELVQR
ncbi:MAG: hypothetical protein JWL71_3697 [Acidobacteria bacterium]|nr:hypothetical protein [Acidobacteriota bacterium]